MRMRRLLSLSLSLVSSLLIVYSVESIEASAALSGGRYLTPSETVAAIGDSLPVTYFDGSDFVTVNAEYVGADTARAVDSFQSTDYLQSGLNTMIYRFSGNVVNDPQYIIVDFQPAFALLDVEFVYAVCGISASGSDISSSVYQTPQWKWTLGNTLTTFEGRADYGLHYRCELSNLYAYGTHYDYVSVSWSHQGETSAISQRVLFSYATPTDGYYYIAFGCPYVSYNGDIDTVSGTSGTSGTSVTSGVNVDLSETNSLLGSIANAISGIWSGITGVFVPDQSFVTGWRSDMADVLGDSFGKYTELDSTLSRVQNAFTQTSGSAVVSFPGVSPPSVGQIIPSSQVSAIPPALQGLLPEIKFAFNILATMLFVNGMKRKWDEIIHGKVVTESESQVL